MYARFPLIFITCSDAAARPTSLYSRQFLVPLFCRREGVLRPGEFDSATLKHLRRRVLVKELRGTVIRTDGLLEHSNNVQESCPRVFPLAGSGS